MNMSNSASLSPQQNIVASQPILAPGEIIIGRLVSLDAQGNPLVDYDCNPDGSAQAAVSTLAVRHPHIGRQVALLFAGADLRRPVIMGFIHNPLDDLLESFSPGNESSDNSSGAQSEDPVNSSEQELRVDGRQVVIEGQDEIVLKCGESSITLTSAGKIIIRGKYLLSRASGVNRILGGSVQVN